MIGGIVHVGITVADLDRSVAFYRDVLGLRYVGEMTMQGEQTDRLFGFAQADARVAYLNGSETIAAPPLEIIQFVHHRPHNIQANLKQISISEICFAVTDIEQSYQRLKAKGVEFLSAPQAFDLSAQGFGKSKAVYFKGSP